MQKILFGNITDAGSQCFERKAQMDERLVERRKSRSNTKKKRP